MLYKIYCFHVYILTNQNRTVLYTGVTNNLEQRLIEHYQTRGNKNSFTGKYHAHFLLYYEEFQYINDAIQREKEIKNWTRKKKMELINTINPELKFLNEDVLGEWPPRHIGSRIEK